MSKIIFSILLLTVLSSCLCTNEDALNYLEDYQQTEKDFIDFLNGANEGFGLFFKLSGEAQCKKVNPKALVLARQIFNELKTLNIKNAFNIVNSVVPKAQQIIDIVTKESTDCVNWGKQLLGVFNKLKAKRESFMYKEMAIFHAMSNMSAITDKSVAAVKQFADKNFYASGKTGGDLMKYLFFWDM